jgi:hypothetical protein
MTITVDPDLSTSIEPLPRGPIIDMNTGQFSQFARNWFEGNRRQNGEILSGINHNRAIIVQLETDYTAADGAVTSAFIAADAVVAADATSARATLSTTLTTAYQAADTALEGTLQADIDTRATIVYVDSVESSLTGSIATQYSTITAEYTAVTDAIAGDVTTNTASISSEASARASADTAIASDVTSLTATVSTNTGNISTNASSISTESSARASGDSANASSITTLEATVAAVGAGSNLCYNSLFSDAPDAGNFANFAPDGWGSLQTNDGTGNYSYGVTGTGVAGAYELPGETSLLIWQNDTEAAGYVYDWRGPTAACEEGDRVLAHVLSGAHRCQVDIILAMLNSSGTEVRYVNGTSNNQEALGGATISSWKKLVAHTDVQSGEVAFRLILRKNQTATGADSFLFVARPMLEIGHATQTSPSPFSPDGAYSVAQVTNIAEAYATDSASTARLVWTVNTSTNSATIEQTAAEGYADGTWNGSAISLTADEITLDGDVIVTGTLTTGKLEANAVSDTAADSTDAAVALSNNTWTNVASATVAVASGADVIISGFCFHVANYSGGASGSSAVTAQVRLRRDSTVLRTQDATTYVYLTGGPGSLTSASRGPTTISDVDLSLSAGTYTYTLQANINLNSVGASSTTRDISNRLLWITQLKR